MAELGKFENPNLPRVGLNGRFLVAQRTGVQRSAYLLFRSIIERGTRYNFVLFTGESESYALEWKRPNVQLVTSPLSQKTSLRNHLWEQIELPRLANKHRVDLLHSPANLAPLFFQGKSVLNIHDLIFLIHPTWFSRSFRLPYRWIVPQIAKRATVVVTNSNHSKNDILERLSIDIERLRLSYWAVDPLFAKYSRPYMERENRMLFVGSLEPRKNLAGLLKAFNIFKKNNPTCPYKLTLVGCENALFANLDYDLGEFRTDIEFVGYINDIDLARLYGNSKMLVYPSFYEGFGFPPLEAMAAGTPVVTSWNTSLPEVVGEAALLANPADPNHIASQIETIYKDAELAQRLSDLGKERVKKFSWQRVADHALDIYDELLERHTSQNRISHSD